MRKSTSYRETFRRRGRLDLTKSTSYRETFRRHRILLSVPIVLAVVISGWLVLSKAPSYSSTANLWVSYPKSANSSLTKASPGIIPPAQQEQGVFKELLATRAFALKVGHTSALAPYLASHASGGSSPLSFLSSKGGGSLDDQIILALGPKQVSTSVPGPQVLQLSYTGPTAAVARSTLGALVTQLQQRSAHYGAGNSLQVIDSPGAATSSVSHKKQLLGILGGLFAGALISFLGAVALTRGKSNPLEDPNLVQNVVPVAASAATSNGNHKEVEIAPRGARASPNGNSNGETTTGVDSGATDSVRAPQGTRWLDDEPVRFPVDDS